MSLLAPGGKTPVYTTALMGIATLCVAIFIHPLGHLVTLVGVLLLMLSAFLANFFRDPNRVIPRDEGVLVASADGHVMFVVRERAIGRRPSKVEIESGDSVSDEHTGEWFGEALTTPLSFSTEQSWERVPVGEEGNEDAWRIAVFMSPLDVHVNRAPLASTITHMEHRTGKRRRRGPFLPAFRKESEFNERVRTVFNSTGQGGHPEGMNIEVTQISGAMARTIVPWSQSGMELRRGQRFGMIRLGSRVDTRAPVVNFTPVVIGAEAEDENFPKGEFVYAGKTILFSPSSLE